MFGLDTFLRPTPDLFREHPDHVFGEAKRLADIAQCALGAIADDSGAESRTMASVGVVYPLDHFFAAFMFKVYVDIGRFLPFLADKAFEQQVITLRVDGGDAKNITDCGIGGRATPLAKNAFASGKANNGIHR